MIKQEQIEEMAKEIFNSGIAIQASDLAYGLIDNDDHFHRLAKYLYAAGYRKIFTSDLTSDTQKAFKRGYEKGYDAGFKDGCNQGGKDNYDRGFSDGQSISRKKTAKEILQNLYNYPHEYHEKRIIELAKHYNVEVEL